MRFKNLFRKKRRNTKPLLDTQSAIKLLNESTDDSMRVKAIKALKPWHRKEELKITLQSAKDSSDEVRKAAVESLRGVIFDEIRDGLIEALKDPSIPIRKAALKNLCEYWPVDAEDICQTIAPEQNKENIPLRCEAIQWLAREYKDKYEKLFTKLLSDPEPEIRKAAVAAINSINNKNHGDILEHLLNDSDSGVRTAVRDFYIKYEDMRALPLLKPTISSPPRLNGPDYSSFQSKLNSFISILRENLKHIPDKDLREYSEMKDIHKEMSYYLEDDPRYDAGHDWYSADYSEIRKAAKEELARRGLKSE